MKGPVCCASIDGARIAASFVESSSLQLLYLLYYHSLLHLVFYHCLKDQLEDAEQLWYREPPECKHLRFDFVI